MKVNMISTTEFTAITFEKVYEKLDSLWSWKDKPNKLCDISCGLVKRFGELKESHEEDGVPTDFYMISDELYNSIAHLIKVDKLKLMDQLPEDFLQSESIKEIEATLIAVVFSNAIGK